MTAAARAMAASPVGAPGGVVAIHGLQGAAELNGEAGLLLDFVQAKGRHAVWVPLDFQRPNPSIWAVKAVFKVS